MDPRRYWTGIACVLASEIIFGLSYLFTKEVTGTTSPLSLLAWRFVIAFLAMWAAARAGLITLNLRGRSLRPLIVLAMFQPVLFFASETYGISLTTASESGAIISAVPIVTLAFSALLLHDNPTRRQVFGISITTLGIIVLVLSKGMEASFSLPGYLSLFVAVTSFSIYSVWVQKADSFSAVEKTYVMTACGAVIFLVLALLEQTQAGTLRHFALLPLTGAYFLGSLLFLAVVSSVGAFFLYNKGIACIGTNKAATFVGVSTVVSVLSGVCVLGESFSLEQTLGATLVLAGVYLANRGAGSQRPMPQAMP